MYLGGNSLNISNALQGAGVGHNFANFSSSIGEKLGANSLGSGLGNSLSSGLSGIGGLASAVGMGAQGLGAALGIANLGFGIHSTMQQMKLAKESLKLARQQFMEENKRYEARENERVNANNQIANTANSYTLNPQNPMSRE
ncbi:hypothetical protein [Helicobacter suis]|uniref:hypothetical protein n=1 Tax=Helicobacter suis TaxID=104628 RepID=UPI0013D57556|nr:hypothetical protein [Helicobacter suis]